MAFSEHDTGQKLVTPREGDLFRIIRTCGKTFEIRYGYYEERDRHTQFAEPVPIYPDFTELPQYTDDGTPFVTAMQNPCESFEGKLAVGNVVLNRVNSSMFPNTVYGVIFDFSCGVQFTPAANGTVYNTPSADSVEAAKQCLDGKNVVGNALFFMNGAIAQSAWISNNRTYIMTIGNHQFYA